MRRTLVSLAVTKSDVHLSEMVDNNDTLNKLWKEITRRENGPKSNNKLTVVDNFNEMNLPCN